MANALLRVPPDSSGKPIAQQSVVRDGDTVHFQEVVAAYPCNGNSVGVDVSTTSAQVLGANLLRHGLKLQNISDTAILIRFGSAPVGTLNAEIGIWLGPYGGDQSLTTLIDQRAVFALHLGSGGVKRLLITEFAG